MAVLTKGDIAFISFNADEDGWAIVTFVDIDPNTIIYFTDNEATSSTAFNTGESYFQWNSGTTPIAAGTVIRFSAIDAAGRAASVGTFSQVTVTGSSNTGLSATAETVYAYLGTSATAPTTFLAGVSNDTPTQGTIDLTTAGLAIGTDAVLLSSSSDYGVYNGARSGQGNFAAYKPLVNNVSNWQDFGDGTFNTSVPDTTNFTVAGALPTVNLSVSANAGSEAGTTVITVTATASSPVSGNQTVTLGVSGTGLTAGDYVLSNALITIASGQTTGSVTFTVVDDALVEGSETAVLTLSNPTSGIALGNVITQNITITDNDSAVGAAPTIAENTATPRLNLAATGSGSVSGAINDPTDPAKVLGVDFTIADSDTPVGNLTVTVSSSNASVVPTANLTLSGTGATRNLKINPVGVGFADILVTVSDGSSSATYTINYAASAASVNPSTTRFLTGTSDASTAIAIDADYMLVGDDEDQTIRLYDRNNSGLPVASFDFTSALGLVGSSEVDIEASTKVGNVIYWMGSHGNNSSGNDRPNRERIFATQVSGTGAATTLTSLGYYQFLENDLIAWDNSNGHGLGAGFLGLAASAAAGVSPEVPNGFNIEGLTLAPNGTTAYVAFRAPNEPTSSRDKALIIPVTNFTTLLNATGGTAGSATFGAPIQLDLGGRGIRSIERNANNEYVIIAGPAGTATGTAPNDFRLYTWTGNPTDAPVLRAADLTALSSGGSFETIVEVPTALTSTSQMQFLVDNGDTVWYNNSTISKDLAQDNFQKFRSEVVALGAAVAPTITKISTIQGSGATATAGTFTIEGIVVGDFQGANQLGGFYLQEETTDSDGNVLTSEGIFVNSLAPVNVGDKVRITGVVAENSSAPSFNQAVITPASTADVTVLATGQQALVSPTVLSLPVATAGELERYEGMLVTFQQELTVTEVFNLGRFGEVSLSANGRLIQPTNVIDPNDSPASGTSSSGTSNVAAVTAQQDLNNRSRIILDDGSSVSNLSDVPYIDTTDANPNNDTLRIGSTVSNLTGVLGFGFSNYRIQATQAPSFNYAPRPALPTVGGSLKVGSFNVLNYFNGDGAGGGFPTSRGADTAVEFGRQRSKIISAIQQLNADVVGLIEMENDGDGANSAIADLVNGLNAAMGAGTYAFVSLANTTGNPGTDEIKVAMIYKPSAVTPVGNAVYFNDPAFTSLGRPPLAQTFIKNSSGEKFTPIVNHFKSKSATGATGADVDQGDGQGAYNATRKLQATALLNFVGQMQTASGDSDVMILGDLNAYGEEDPIDILRAGGFTKLTTATDSYVFDGQTGSLDHALVSASLLSQVTGAAKWNINSDEPIALDYNDDVLSPGEAPAEDRNDTTLYQPNAFRSSDHDPVLVGLNLQTPVNVINGTAGRDTLTGTAGKDRITGGASADTLTGGAGSDEFVYANIADGRDTITDFVVGTDKIVLTPLFQSLNLSLTYSSAIAGGYLSFTSQGSTSFFLVDRDGSAGAAGRPIALAGVQNVTVSALNNAANFVI
jgi:predicted extracellular nuclease